MLIFDEDVRHACGITRIVVPPHPPVKGELFFDGSVQKVLSGVIGLFSVYVKYPRRKGLMMTG